MFFILSDIYIFTSASLRRSLDGNARVKSPFLTVREKERCMTVSAVFIRAQTNF